MRSEEKKYQDNNRREGEDRVAMALNNRWQGLHK